MIVQAASHPAWFHLHIYFDAQTQDSARQLRQQILMEDWPLAYVGTLIPHAIGPHPRPMFELHAASAHLDAVCARLEARRGPHSVLIHPVQADEYAAHTRDARWLGPALALRLDRL